MGGVCEGPSGSVLGPTLVIWWDNLGYSLVRSWMVTKSFHDVSKIIAALDIEI